MPRHVTVRPRGFHPHRARVVLPRDRESGSALLLALLFLGVILTLVTVLLLGARTSAQSVQGFRDDRTLRYGADGALEATIEMLHYNPQLAMSLTTPVAIPNCLQVPLIDGNPPGNRATVTSGSYLQVSCISVANASAGATQATPTSSATGYDVDGNELAREVLLTVTCASTVAPTSVGGKIDCQNGASPRTLASARVRFDIDPGNTTNNLVTCPSGITSTTVCNQWADVSKIVSWKLSRTN